MVDTYSRQKDSEGELCQHRQGSRLRDEEGRRHRGRHRGNVCRVLCVHMGGGGGDVLGGEEEVVVEAVVLWCLNRQGDALSTHVEEERRRRMLWRSAQRMLSSLYLLFSVYIF